MTFSPPCHPGEYCPRAVVVSRRGGRTTEDEHLLLLEAQLLGVEGGRLLHGDQGHQLEEVVLDDVAGGTDAVVVAGAAADADVLGHGDLHVVDVVGVPDRLEHVVGEAHRQDVLDRLLAEVVVDAEDRPRGEDGGQHVVELARRLEVVAEGLLDHHATPRGHPGGVDRRLGQPVLLELRHHGAEERRGDGEVEGRVAAGAARLVELAHGPAQGGEGVVVVEVARHEAEALGELAPHLLAEGRACVLLDRVVDDLREVLVGPVAPGEADEREARGQQPAVGEVVDRRHDLLAGQVAGDAEEHQARRARDAREPSVLGIPERVGSHHAADQPRWAR